MAIDARQQEFTRLCEEALDDGEIKLTKGLARWMGSNTPELKKPWAATLLDRMGSAEARLRAAELLDAARSASLLASFERSCEALSVAAKTGTMAERRSAKRQLDDTVLLAQSRSSDAMLAAAISFGANIDAKDNGGKTALLRAVEAGDATFIQALLDKGAKMEMLGPEGSTAVEKARKILDQRRDDAARLAASQDVVGLLDSTAESRSIAQECSAADLPAAKPRAQRI